MCSYTHYLFFIIGLNCICVRAQYSDLIVNLKLQDTNLLQDKFQHLQGLQKQIPHTLPQRNQQQQSRKQGKLKIQLFYESLCPDCRVFDTQQFAPTVKKLSNYINVHVYPYGNAKTIIHANGKIEFLCQHGPAECYGNILHACAIDILGNITQAVEFNTCMMSFDQTNGGSNNDAADKCGRLMNIDSTPIKQCAVSPRGSMLLKKYGDESKKVGFSYVPYVLLDGKVYSGNHFLRDICDSFESPPPECNE